MKTLYVTDLHGNVAKYERVLGRAREIGARCVVNGGDLYPHRGRGPGAGRSRHETQRQFIAEFLSAHFATYDREGIAFLTIPGNDDLAVMDPLFREAANGYREVRDLTAGPAAVGGFTFLGMPWVCDTPFRLKDRSRRDDDGFVSPEQLGTPVLSTADGFEEIADLDAHLRALPTVEEELSALDPPEDPERAVYVIHMPPAGLKLDLCGHGPAVGSGAVRRFIEARQPLFALHGHIHESPDISGRWRAQLGKTTVIQPGQPELLSYVEIELASRACERRIEPIL